MVDSRQEQEYLFFSRTFKPPVKRIHLSGRELPPAFLLYRRLIIVKLYFHSPIRLLRVYRVTVSCTFTRWLVFITVEFITVVCYENNILKLSVWTLICSKAIRFEGCCWIHYYKRREIYTNYIWVIKQECRGYALCWVCYASRTERSATFVWKWTLERLVMEMWTSSNWLVTVLVVTVVAKYKFFTVSSVAPVQSTDCTGSTFFSAVNKC